MKSDEESFFNVGFSMSSKQETMKSVEESFCSKSCSRTRKKMSSVEDSFSSKSFNVTSKIIKQWGVLKSMLYKKIK